MPYITREDGERFVIPSYRDVISAKKPGLLKKEIILLSENYGEYITLQRKNVDQYEVAFSPEPGYLLGETVWHYFKRPLDLIYCEQIPNTSEAILVIVKSGSVYLDGSFPLDSIPDELVIFRTQQNNFEIYIHGDVPISQAPEEDKFSLDPSSVRSFKILDQRIFPELPLINAFRLQLVDTVLKEQRIGALPIRNILIILSLLILGWLAYNYFSTRTEEIPQVFRPLIYTNPYQDYIDSLSTPDAGEQIQWVANHLVKLFSIPGWFPITMKYTPNSLTAVMRSFGVGTDMLFSWAAVNQARVGVDTSGFYLTFTGNIPNRPSPTTIIRIPEVIANITDKLSYIVPGNNLTVGKIVATEDFSQTDVQINLTNTTANVIYILGEQLKQLPLQLTTMEINLTANGSLSGTINLKVLGN